MFDEDFDDNGEALRDVLARPARTIDKPVRFHYLKAMAKSARHCKAAFDSDEAASTSAQQRGSTVHAMLFETKRFACMPQGKKRAGKEYQAIRDAFPGAEVLTHSAYNQACRMVDALRADKAAIDILGAGVAEKTRIFNWMGRQCRTTPDTACHDFVAELKTTKDASPDRFTSQSKWYGYHAQHAFHLAAFASSVSRAFTIAIETTPPYVITVFEYDRHALNLGERFNRLQMERVIQCEQSNAWPPYAQQIVKIDVEEDVDLIFADDESEAAP